MQCCSAVRTTVQLPACPDPSSLRRMTMTRSKTFKMQCFEHWVWKRPLEDACAATSSTMGTPSAPAAGSNPTHTVVVMHDPQTCLSSSQCGLVSLLRPGGTHFDHDLECLNHSFDFCLRKHSAFLSSLLRTCIPHTSPQTTKREAGLHTPTPAAPHESSSTGIALLFTVFQLH